MKTGEKCGFLFPLLAVVLAAGSAYALVMDPLSEWLSHERLVDGLSSTVPEWRGTWDYSGARTGAYAASDLSLVCLAAFSALTLWLAGMSRSPVPRTLWLFATLCTSIGIVGAGEPGVLYAILLSVASTACVVWAFRIPEERRFYFNWKGGVPKVLLLSLVAGGGVYFAMSFVWGRALIVTGVASPSMGWIISLMVIVLAGLVLVMNRKWRIHPAIPAAVLAAVLVPKSGSGGPGTWPYSPGVFYLQEALKDYRATESESAVMRFSRPEKTTVWEAGPALQRRASGSDEARLLRLWLLADEAIYREFSDAKTKAESLRAAESELDKFDGRANPVAYGEIAGWLAYSTGRFDVSRQAFRKVLVLNKNDPMAWYGMALAEIGAGRTKAAESALTAWCLLDPRALFSPAWARTPLSGLRAGVLVRWRQIATRQDAGMNAESRNILKRYGRWLDAYEATPGNMGRFLQMTADVETDGTVRVIRTRLAEVLAKPEPIRIAAVLSAAVALTTDRHVDLGQCRALYELMAGGSPPESVRGILNLRTRPRLSGWPARFTEGGAGATLHDFEENLPIRMTTYGWCVFRPGIPADILNELASE